MNRHKTCDTCHKERSIHHFAIDGRCFDGRKRTCLACSVPYSYTKDLTHKRCYQCGETKTTDNFNRDLHKRDGLNTYCKACVKKFRPTGLAAEAKSQQYKINAAIRLLASRDNAETAALVKAQDKEIKDAVKETRQYHRKYRARKKAADKAYGDKLSQICDERDLQEDIDSLM